MTSTNHFSYKFWCFRQVIFQPGTLSDSLIIKFHVKLPFDVFNPTLNGCFNPALPGQINPTLKLLLHIYFNPADMKRF